MNDEIKEILSYLKKKENTRRIKCITIEESKQLLDYIINLQQENEDNLKCINSLKEQLESVINENQRLLKQWFENNDKTVKLVSEKECYKSNYNDYKSRCEKAIEYINTHKEKLHHSFDEPDCDYWIATNPDILLNILQNGSDSQ